jgi:hypothetical protein
MVPDFRALHKQNEMRLKARKAKKAPTVPVEFAFAATAERIKKRDESASDLKRLFKWFKGMRRSLTLGFQKWCE